MYSAEFHLNVIYLYLYRYLQKSMETFNEVADKWIQRLNDLADGKTEIKMSDMLCRVTLDMIGKVWQISVTLTWTVQFV